MSQLELPALRPRRLTAGCDRWVLVVDFQPFADGPRLGELLAAGEPDRSILQLDPALDLAGADYLPLSNLVEGYRDALEPGLVTDRASDIVVVGHCGAAVLAAGIADVLAGPNVSLLLIRPSWPDDSLVSAMLASVRSELSATGPVPLPIEEPAARLDRVIDQLREDLDSFATARRFDPAGSAARHLLGRYRGWFGYLIAAWDALDRGWQPDRQLPLQVFTDAEWPTALPWPAPPGFHQLGFELPTIESAATQRLAAELASYLRRHR